MVTDEQKQSIEALGCQTGHVTEWFDRSVVQADGQWFIIEPDGSVIALREESRQGFHSLQRAVYGPRSTP